MADSSTTNGTECYLKLPEIHLFCLKTIDYNVVKGIGIVNSWLHLHQITRNILLYLSIPHYI